MQAPITLQNGLQKCYGTYLAYWAQYEFKEGTIHFEVEHPAFFLFFMLEGSVSFTGITRAESNTCYATFNQAAKFEAIFSDGMNRLLYIAIDSPWLESMIKEFPALRPLFYRFLQGELTFGLLPAYPISKRIHELLSKLTTFRSNSKAELEAHTNLFIVRLLSAYHSLLHNDRQRTNDLAYQALNYISTHYREPQLHNALIANVLCTTIQTLIRIFKAEFDITPRAYLQHLRMRYAHAILRNGNIPLKQVHEAAGFEDAHSFRTAFSRYYGYPPKNVKK